MKLIWAGLGLLLLALVGFGAGTFWVLGRGLPQVSTLEEFTPPSSTRIHAADGTLLAEFATQKRTPVPLEEIPPDLIRTVLAIEDHRFFDHFGINIGRVLKALAVDVMRGGFVEGGSTITQQLAKVLFLTPEKTLARKIREALLALEIERRYTKDEILAFYLNQIYLGNGAYGVAAAAVVYFDKPLADLDLAECALLAALPKAPSLYDPFRNPERALGRRNIVLRRLAALEWLDAEKAALAAAVPLPAARTPRLEIRAPYFVEAVRRELLAKLGADRVYQGGLRVYTTLDTGLQTAAEKALAGGLATVEQRHKGKRQVSPVQGAVLALDAQTGAVRAQIGGRDWQESSFDRATQARRQPGSSYKPFTYLAALETGWTQASTLLDAPASYRGASPDSPWKPQNYDHEFRGRMTLRSALADSRNLPVVRLMEAVGRDKVEAVARRLGLEGPLGEGLAAALGVGGVSLEELVRAYACLVNGGYRTEPHRIRAVFGPDGRNLWSEQAPPPRRVLEPAVAYVASDLLRAVVDSGTGRAARALPFHVGGKTGTTDDQRDAWFVGFSSRVAAGVWVGRDDNSPLGRGETGSRAALPVWIDVMLASAADGPPPPWATPATVGFAEIDLHSGLRSGPECGESAFAAFVAGTEPEVRCDTEAFHWDRIATRLQLNPKPARKIQ